MKTRSIILSAPLLLLFAACAEPEEGEDNLSNFSATANSGASVGESSIGISSLGTSVSASGSASASASASSTDGTDGTGTDTDTDTGVIDTDTDGTDSSTSGDTDTTDGTDSSTSGDTDTTGTTGDTDGTTGDTDTTGMEFPDDAIFVHGEDGLDSNPGTADEPKRTIQAGITAAAELPEGKVYVAEGTYELDFQNNKYITLVDGVSLYGGYSADDWEVRNISDTPSVLIDKSASGGSSSEPNRALDGGDDVGPDTVVDGFTIQGGTGSYATAVRVYKSEPTFTNNTIIGGAADGLTSYGVWILDAEPTFTENDIRAGVAAGLTRGYGVFINNNAHAVIDGNHIHGGGGGSYSTGIAVYSSNPMIYNNVINGGSGSSNVRSIELSTASPSIYNNTIISEKPSTAYGVFISSNSQPKIDNNIITLASYCIYEGSNTAKSASIRNNDLMCTNYAARIGWSAKTHTDLAPMELDCKNGGGLASGNIKIEPTFVDIAKNDAHLLGDGDTFCDLSQGAMDHSMSFTLDRDREERSDPWSIGAHELDGACK